MRRGAAEKNKLRRTKAAETTGDDMWRAVWNGPFYVGPLTRPISVGDVLMKLLETLWRAAVIMVAAVAALLAMLWTQDKRASDARDKALRNTTVAASYDPDTCGFARPIKVLVTNTGKRPLSYVSYEVMILSGAGGQNLAPTSLSNLSVTDVPAGMRKRVCLTTVGYDGSVLSLRPEMIIQSELKFVNLP